METVFFARVDTGLHFSHILPHGSTDVARFGEEIFGEFGDMAAGYSECVVHHQNLSIGNVTCANTDNRDRQRFGNAFRQLNRHTFQYQQLRSRGFQGQRIAQQPIARIATALH